MQAAKFCPKNPLIDAEDLNYYLSKANVEEIPSFNTPFTLFKKHQLHTLNITPAYLLFRPEVIDVFYTTPQEFFVSCIPGFTFFKDS